MHLDQLEAIFELNGKRIVDVGAGDGGLAAAMAGSGARVTGIEVDPNKVAQARSANGDHAEFLVGSGQSLPIDSGSTDLVSFMFSMHHIPAQLQPDAILEALRVLATGGRIHVVEPDVFGAMTEVLRPVEDETQVRTATQDFLNSVEANYPLRLEKAARYDLSRTYRDFNAWIQSVVMVDPARAEKLPRVRHDMEQMFERRSRRTTAGHVLTQPCIMHHFVRQ